MAIEVYINFNKNCREAVEFYEKVFETDQPKIMTFGDIPSDPAFPLSEEDKKLIMHTFLTIEGSKIMFSDVPSGMPFVQGNNISLTVGFNNIDKLKSVFNRLKEDGTVTMELQETFWSKCYGYLIDKFGIGWQLVINE
ncbi:MAG: glyoxalase family protein [Herbinix sp.]|jgi:PhnB protein|nr:glyoxalase family protein [Herbinix sp.]